VTSRACVSYTVSPSRSVLRSRQPNILVDEKGVARLSDFGNTVVLFNTTGNTRTQAAESSMPWTAPELLWYEPARNALDPHIPSDIFALSSVIWEVRRVLPLHAHDTHGTTQVFARQAPFAHLSGTKERVTNGRVLAGMRPEPRPAAMADSKWDHLWELMQRAWLADFGQRPHLYQVATALRLHTSAHIILNSS
jgi:serine/threonine protein kinase